MKSVTKRRTRKVRGPRRAAWRGPMVVPPVTAAEKDEEKLAKLAEATREDEDDFADGRSSAGLRMRAEEDEWGRGEIPDEPPSLWG